MTTQVKEMKTLRTKSERAYTRLQQFVMFQNAGRDEMAIEQFNKAMKLLEDYNNGDMKAY